MNSVHQLLYQKEEKLLRTLFFALLAGQILFFLIAVFLQKTFEPDSNLLKILDYAVPLLLLGLIILSRFVYRQLVSRSKKLPFEEKILSYRSAVIVSLAMLEAANIISITAFMLTGEYIYAAASLILFLLFILGAPSADKLIIDLELGPEELSEIDQQGSAR